MFLGGILWKIYDCRLPQDVIFFAQLFLGIAVHSCDLNDPVELLRELNPLFLELLRLWLSRVVKIN
jgi:hypothetical protein